MAWSESGSSVTIWKCQESPRSYLCIFQLNIQEVKVLKDTELLLTAVVFHGNFFFLNYVLCGGNQAGLLVPAFQILIRRKYNLTPRERLKKRKKKKGLSITFVTLSLKDQPLKIPVRPTLQAM